MTRVQIPHAFAPLWEPARYKASWGGRGSAKSHSFAQTLAIMGVQRPIRWLFGREIQKSLQDSVYQLMLDKIEAAGLSSAYRPIKSRIYGPDGTLFIFEGLRSNPESIKSLEGLDGAWLEEANRVSKRSLQTLIPTLRKDGSELWASWNPDQPDDPVDDMFRNSLGAPPKSILMPVSWRDNPFFPQVLVDELEWCKRRDPDEYEHVWEGGYRARSKARVFNNWIVEETPEPPAGTVFRFGADFGFAVDPTTLVRCWVHPDRPRTLVVDYEAWEVGCEIDHTPALFAGDDERDRPRWENPQSRRGVPEVLRSNVRADSARPETISYLKQRGFSITGALKGPGSVMDGIEFIKTFDLLVHPRCKHVIDELKRYSFKVDPHTEEVLPVLVDKKNHTIDALRYAVEGLRRAGFKAIPNIRVGGPTREAPSPY